MKAMQSTPDPITTPDPTTSTSTTTPPTPQPPVPGAEGWQGHPYTETIPEEWPERIREAARTLLDWAGPGEDLGTGVEVVLCVKITRTTTPEEQAEHGKNRAASQSILGAASRATVEEFRDELQEYGIPSSPKSLVDLLRAVAGKD